MLNCAKMMGPICYDKHPLSTLFCKILYTRRNCTYQGIVIMVFIFINCFSSSVTPHPDSSLSSYGILQPHPSVFLCSTFPDVRPKGVQYQLSQTGRRYAYSQLHGAHHTPLPWLSVAWCLFKHLPEPLIPEVEDLNSRVGRGEIGISILRLNKVVLPHPIYQVPCEEAEIEK